MTTCDPPRGAAGPSRPPGRRRMATWLATILLAGGIALAQPRAELVLGLAGAPVAGAWTPLRATVRDAPGARLLLEIDAGGLDRGEVVQRGAWTFPDASGVQRLDLDLPLPAWRQLSWRIEHGGRTLASGALGARERDDRPLTLVVSAVAADLFDLLPADARPVPATAADLPARAAPWDGVATLLLDGTAAAPSAEVVLAAAAAGVRVLLPATQEGGYAALRTLLEPGGLRVGAGVVQPLPADREGIRTALAVESADAIAPSVRNEVRAAAREALPATTWTHLPRGLVVLVASVYAAAAWGLLRLGGAAGAIASAMLVAAAGLATPWSAPADPAPVREGAVVLEAGGLGVRSDLREVARLPRGEVVLRGTFAPADALPLAWSEGSTRVPLAPGERVRLVGAPRLVSVPEGLRAAAPAARPPAAFADVLPVDLVLRERGTTWWLSRDPRPVEARAEAGR